jgi:hypothetical protein
VNDSSSFSSFEWYLDDGKLSTTISPCSLSSSDVQNLHLGIHQLTVIAWKGTGAAAVPYSHSITLLVTE